MRPLKYLPWNSLFLSASVTMAVVTVIDHLLYLGLLTLFRSESPILAVVPLPIASLLQQIAPVAAGFGVGALALIITIRFFPEIPLRADTMWALNGCLIPLLFVKVLLPIDGLLVYPEVLSVAMMIVGVFVVGKRYWR